MPLIGDLEKQQQRDWARPSSTCISEKDDFVYMQAWHGRGSGEEIVEDPIKYVVKILLGRW